MSVIVKPKANATTSSKKTKAKLKMKILLKVEKTTNGLSINLKSKDLHKFTKEFYTTFYGKRNESFNYLPNPQTIISSLRWNSGYARNGLIRGNIINLHILEYFRADNISVKTYELNNVFTNEEINTYIEQFETMLIKMKQLLTDNKSLKNKIKNKLVKQKTQEVTELSMGDYIMSTSSIPSWYDSIGQPEIREVAGNRPSRTESRFSPDHDPENCEVCQSTRRAEEREIERNIIDGGEQ